MQLKHNQLLKPIDILNSGKLKDKVSLAITDEIAAGLVLQMKDPTFDSVFEFAAEKIKSGDLPSDKMMVKHSLTSRERQVLILLAQGLTNEQISRDLVVVVKTVEKHVANILMKLGLKNRTEAAAWAIENEIVK
jgi:DNA-binding NarL/FixJ family response regulator